MEEYQNTVFYSSSISSDQYPYVRITLSDNFVDIDPVKYMSTNMNSLVHSILNYPPFNIYMNSKSITLFHSSFQNLEECIK